MKEKRLLDAITDIKDEYIEEVMFHEKEERTQASSKRNINWRNSWIYCMGMVASIAFVILIGTKISKTDFSTNHGLIFETECPEHLSIDLGFSVEVVQDGMITIEENTQFLIKNPSWNLRTEEYTWPVYKNLSYVSPAGPPVYFSKAELLSMAEEVAKRLGTNLIEWDYHYTTERKENLPYEIYTKSELAEIIVSGNGKIAISFYEPIALPEGYVFSKLNITLR